MALARVSSPSHSLLSLPSYVFPSLLLPHYSSLSTRRSLPVSCAAAASAAMSQSPLPPPFKDDGMMDTSRSSSKRPWKPTCLYYTQGKCTMMDDAAHLEKFNHNLLVDLPVDVSALGKLRPQKLDYLLVLDLEGKVEILEFPVVMIDVRSMKFIDSFHRFVRPTSMGEQRIKEYIEGKYGQFGVDRVWHDTAIPFEDVLQEFENWIGHHNLWRKEHGGSLKHAAFITCGNWDLKTKVPEQCRVSKIKLPSYFMEWINLKDIYLNFYNRRATGMMTMMRELEMPIVGSHHLGIDDAKNIARIAQRMLADGVVMQITAKRHSSAHGDVTFTFKNRIR